MRYFFTIIFIILTVNILTGEWNYRYSGQGISTSAAQDDMFYMGRMNGITELNTKTGEMKNLNTLNSDLKSNYINSFINLEDGSILVSTMKGLSVIEDGVITSNKPICKDYPDTDSRLLYKTKDGTIWTFSASKVHMYKMGFWKSFDISDSVKYSNGTVYPFEIYRLFVRDNEVWALFNDLSKSSTKFYFKYVIDLQLRVAIINQNGIMKTFQNKNEFPMRQGSVEIADLGDEIIWKNYDGVYSYKDNFWNLTKKMNFGDYEPFWYQDFIPDNNGNIWYSVSDSTDKIVFPVSYNLSDGKINRYFTDSLKPYIYGISILSDGTVTARSTNDLYIKNGNDWKKYTKEMDMGMASNDYFYVFENKIQNKTYVTAGRETSPEPWGTLICLEDGKRIQPISFGFPYRYLQKAAVNNYGKGIYEGYHAYMEPLSYEADSAFVRILPLSIGNVSKIKLASDGNVYFNNFRLNKETVNAPFLTTWSGNEIVKLDMGFSDKDEVALEDFDSKGNLIFGLGSYSYETDNLNSYLTIYDTKSKKFTSFDKNNSDLPDWYWTHEGMFYARNDTFPKFIQVDSDYNLWILTSQSLQKFYPYSPYDSEKHPITELNNFFVKEMHYDTQSNEILFKDNYLNFIVYFDIDNEQWQSFYIINSGIKGKVLALKKLFDENIYASDDLGYLYKYLGNGKFKQLDLNISGKSNLGFAINDICMNGNKVIYLATEIGLFYNDNFVSVEEQETIIADDLQISPNPASDYIEVNVGANGHLPLQEIRIFDIFGNEMHPPRQTASDTPQEGNKYRIDISALPAGVYFVRIGEKVEKFVKI